MFLGRYDFDGDADELRTAYERLMTGEILATVTFQVCVTREGGLSVYDTCPSEEVFEAFSTSPQTLAAFRAAGLPEPSVTKLGPVVQAWAAPQHVTPSASA